ncbi:MAG: YajQ family cyclic di-GMP-binding protein [Verrucomicrobia bacterium]|nr:YajQ family cyclic di-GMP-binding protein [Verrucomicrobiota bacterium]
MPSFDIVSKVSSMEVENAISQAQKELLTRFDFKGSGAEIVLEKSEIKMRAPDAFKMTALVEIVMLKLAKRSISAKNIDAGEAELSPLGHARQTIKIKQGIESAAAKEISNFVRGLGLKVTASIQGDELRVPGKNRDDLQAVMTACRAHDFPVALNFVNFRD